jgi:hypothetical protein
MNNLKAADRRVSDIQGGKKPKVATDLTLACGGAGIQGFSIVTQ